ncbi:hypothetical protein MTR_6g045373 [Medicago truncatula]|uniref:DNA helicase n=1 Tax=Medicago truncatula TaxID=3880 RepID=A0A072U912_MEDTR|nr:hypothetical protein MTR_6g045373 [Medicago truncatula]
MKDIKMFKKKLPSEPDMSGSRNNRMRLHKFISSLLSRRFSREEHNLFSFDEVEGDTHNLYQQEFLNSISQGSIRPYILKEYVGYENRSRKQCWKKSILAQYKCSLGLPFVLSRKQFPIRLSLAFTINKSQGQTIPNVEIYIPRHVFSHGNYM